MKLALFSAFFAIIFAYATASFALPPPEIRLLVMSNKRVFIEGFSEQMSVLPRGKRPDKKITFRGSVTISAGDRGLILNSLPVGDAVMITNRTKQYKIGDRSFRGKIEAIWKSKDKLLIVNHLPMEEYLVGILGSEVYPNWPMEALKAQAVAARTYALHHADIKKQNGVRGDYDVTSTVLSQVYEGTQKEGFRAHQACKETEGMTLLRNGSIFPTYYHSCCGGLTEHAHNVWDGENGPRQITDKFCTHSPKMNWTWQTSTKNFISKLGSNDISIKKIHGITTELQEDSPRVDVLIIADEDGAKSIEATELRRIFGFSNIKSTWFDVEIQGSRIAFTGRGYGHGVGMCQWGTKGMADKGFTYEDILKFYYPDAVLTRAY